MRDGKEGSVAELVPDSLLIFASVSTSTLAVALVQDQDLGVSDESTSQRDQLLSPTERLPPSSSMTVSSVKRLTAGVAKPDGEPSAEMRGGWLEATRCARRNVSYSSTSSLCLNGSMLERSVPLKSSGS